MKRVRLILTAGVGAILFAFLSGCGQPSGQETKARANRARETSAPPAGAQGAEDVAGGDSNGPIAPSGETKPEVDSTKGQPTDLGAFAFPDGPQPVAKGKETLLLPDGTVYEGESSEGKPNGQGAMTNPNGTHQQGEWRYGRAYRLSGTWVAPDGTKEVGTWNLDGTMSGGTITWTDGREYKGDWKCVAGADELPDGIGVMIWPDGRKYVGRFHDGTMDGTGKMTYPNGKIEEGVWKQDKFVEATK